MDRPVLNAEVREVRGTRKSNQIRGKGMVPAVLYGAGQQNVSLQIEAKALRKALHGKGGEHAIIDLQVSGGSVAKPLKKTVIVKEVQHDFVRDAVLHVDFAAISLTEKLVVKVPIVDIGEPVGVTQGGVLEHIVREIEVECLPSDIPANFSVDVTPLKIGDSIKLSDIAVPQGVRVIGDPALTIFTVSVPKVEVVEEAAPAEGEAAAAEGAAPAEGEEKKPVEGKESAKGKEEAKGKKEEQPKGKDQAKAKE